MRRSALAAASLCTIAVLFWIRCGALPDALLDERHFVSTTIVDRNGEVLYEPLSARGNRSQWLGPSALPPNLINATVAAEDRRFFSHCGLDPMAIARAVAHDLRALRVVEGGSTITQQVAKQLLAFDPADGASPMTVPARAHRGLVMKMREAILALRLEHHLTKREILALYLNLVPYGNQAVGASRASRRYFGCPPGNLTIAQSAFLAALPQRPARLNPYRRIDGALRRQRQVLGRMHAMGAIDERDLTTARAERLRVVREDPPLLAPHFLEHVMAALNGSRPLRVETSLDARLQREVRGIIAAQQSDLERHGAHSVAVAVLDNATGEWLAWEGSGNYFGKDFGGAIDGVVTSRQPGSALKPFTYALAFEQGSSPATVLADVESHFATAQEGIVYTPRNYDGRYRGPLRARLALAGSENVPAVEVLSRVGSPSLLRFLRHAGLTTFDHTADYYGLGLTLGDAEVRLDELVAAYAAFARAGTLVEPRMIRSVDWTGLDGAAPRMNPRSTPIAAQLVSPRTAFWISDILSDGDARQFIFGTGGSLDFPFPVAVKTGTSQSYRDNWTIGYTKQVTVGVWVGNFDRSSLRNSSGVTGAGPVFHAVMLAAMSRVRGNSDAGHDDQAALAAPTADLERVDVCALSGLRPSDACPNVVSEWLPRDQTAEFCSWHGRGPSGAVVRWPAEYRQWARGKGLEGGAPRALPKSVASRKLRIVNPPDGAVYLIDPTLRTAFQSLPLRVATGGDGIMKWSVDGRDAGSCRANAHVQWPLEAGRHTISVSDGSGNSETVRVIVK